MPIFFFDSRDGDDWVRDEFGIEVAGLDEARNQATAGLGDMAKDSFPNSHSRDMAIDVRDEGGRVLLRASLRLDVEFL
jgi:hypothetical protein